MSNTSLMNENVYEDMLLGEGTEFYFTHVII